MLLQLRLYLSSYKNRNIKGLDTVGLDQIPLYSVHLGEFAKRMNMQVLNKFHEISGLQINVEKYKVVKIGLWRDIRTILCRNLDLAVLD